MDEAILFQEVSGEEVFGCVGGNCAMLPAFLSREQNSGTWRKGLQRRLSAAGRKEASLW